MPPRRRRGGLRLAHGLLLLGRELELAPPADDLLGVDAGLVAVVDAGEHDARLGVVEQRDRHRLAAGELVVGVVADERSVGDRARHRRFEGPDPRLELRRDVPRVLAQVVETGLQLGAMRDKVAR